MARGVPKVVPVVEVAPRKDAEVVLVVAVRDVVALLGESARALPRRDLVAANLTEFHWMPGFSRHRCSAQLAPAMTNRYRALFFLCAIAS